jgi:hypothetical protein
MGFLTVLSLIDHTLLRVAAVCYGATQLLKADTADARPEYKIVLSGWSSAPAPFARRHNFLDACGKCSRLYTQACVRSQPLNLRGHIAELS